MFPVFRMRAEVAVATSGDQEAVISVSEIGFDVPLLSHFLFQDYRVSPSLPEKPDH